MTTRQESLKAALTPVLHFVRDRWADKAIALSKREMAQGVGMCRYTAAFLACQMKPRWRFAGGAQDWRDGTGLVGDGGYFDGSAWHPHHWVTDGELIVDLAATQFGGAAIEVVPVNDARYCGNYLRRDCVEAVRGVSQGLKEWNRLYAALDRRDLRNI
ncbi:hypothetical protein [Burkholderia cenocepacia]|uniref:hypothetical protein n=1 Tax=Burkholderia cenocepacia TaxID=95486 RepID=UPI000761D8BA|nr:hypothetical protein [Burkholderia cenocepacia]KWU17753.1 hypothetical protein AS149_13615 [Burkholderia cenocepacia]